MTPQAAVEKMKEQLDEKKCSMLFAAESGSRAWGFASKDSDHDIRFIYVKSVVEYLALDESSDSFSWMSDNRMIDVVGWDLKKALRLAKKSNPSLIEWLGSNIVYCDDLGLRESLRSIMNEHFSAGALAHHYINFMRDVKGKDVADISREPTLKRYFYALRPILIVQWMQDNPGKLPPIKIQDLLEASCLDKAVINEIVALLDLKMAGKELDPAANSQIIENFIQGWFDKGREIADNFPAREVPAYLLDNLFYETLAKINWGDGVRLVFT